MTAKEAAKYIDISAVRAQNTYSDIIQLVEHVKEYHFINVHVLPCWVSTLAGMLKHVEGVYVGAPAGFPTGAHTTQVKLYEAKQLINDGVEEMDIVMNIGRLKSHDYTYVKKELDEIISFAKGKVLTKVIIEINLLSDAEVLQACDLVMASGADFVKTGTGYIPGGANLERIRKIKTHCKNDIRIKAAGGIRTRTEFDALVDIGVERMGINTDAAIQIVRLFK